MTIKVVGIGLEGKKSLNDQVLEIVCSANILVGGDRHLSYFPEHKGERIKIGDLNQVIFEIKEKKKEGINIVILASGDPLFFGIGRILLANFAQEELEFYPNLSCVQLAFNKLKTSWQDCKVISLHGRDIELLIKELKKGSEKIALLTDNNNNPLVIWRLYQQIKIGEDYDIWLCENLGDKSQEKLTKINSEKDINLDNISPLNIVIFLNQKIEDNAINIHQLPIIGIPDNYFKTFPDRPSLITKNEIRLLILGKLALQEKQVIWDVGAGTGSVSIEMARIAKNSQIYAIEKKAIAISLIRENCQKFMVNNINIIHNSAEKVMATLPSPDRVFIGGSSGNLKLLLNIIKDKINPEGKIVIALATIENLGIAVEWFKENKWDYEIINSQINKSLSIGKMTRFNPLNPVNIITAIKN
ncbi:precorrin-6y C5,15-methyltransferase (decarboxylating) subunit CbiE [Cyanobacterium aponinum AL20118]|uniref:Precorrin-6y C5,15-methyltransferase (Decarboxylating) subunit CbiE n=1 Tax=Cyanobacterium aponinum AL20115 TaxID=3090662 RepID=A0AAF0ZBK7_9CHRO|nr:precorrin-6y C5,15-methyltransferase (decarboxylating) subunit CbiE [Cyanobacterium aponinum]WPF87298.1 precorrin-6y C5,15-methyltransferase (decarboxylating) subunit CbiE [Cyanobacterium aponinum AL20115]